MTDVDSDLIPAARNAVKDAAQYLSALLLAANQSQQIADMLADEIESARVALESAAKSLASAL